VGAFPSLFLLEPFAEGGYAEGGYSDIADTKTKPLVSNKNGHPSAKGSPKGAFSGLFPKI
jgi:hypothetical protein